MISSISLKLPSKQQQKKKTPSMQKTTHQEEPIEDGKPPHHNTVILLCTKASTSTTSTSTEQKQIKKIDDDAMMDALPSSSSTTKMMDEEEEYNTEEEEEVITIDGEKVKDLEVTKVLYEGAPSSKRVLIFQCKTASTNAGFVCLKLMDNHDVFRNEKAAYERMQHGVEHLFLKVYFFCDVIMPDKRVWKGYCMQEGKYSVRDILATSSSSLDMIPATLAQKKILQDILQDKENFLKQKINTMEEEVVVEELPDDDGGMPVIFQQDQSIQMSIAIAVLRLLHHMHIDRRWVHGDTHMGNFMYLNKKIYAIDFERSFGSTDSVQHLLDLQEFFGHLSGILLNMVRHNDWDMRDIFGLYYYRHPLFEKQGGEQGRQKRFGGKSSNFSRRNTLYLLPLCTCFTCPTPEMRIEGCSFCKSPLSLQSAEFVEKNFENEVIQDLSNWGLLKMKNGLAFTRTNTIMKQCCNMANLIYPCIQDGSVLKMKLDHHHSIKEILRRNKMVMSMMRKKDGKDSDDEEDDYYYYCDNDDSKLANHQQTNHDTPSLWARSEHDKAIFSLLSSKFVNEITKSKQQCVAVLKRMLYMPAMNEKAKLMMMEIVVRLKVTGFVQAANTLWVNTAKKEDGEEAVY